MYWSGAKIAAQGTSLVQPFQSSLIDCAAYTLRMGDECYLTKEPGKPWHQKSPSELQPASANKSLGEGFRIEPGQFAYLLTLEDLSIPDDVLAFISLKATFKWKGLINVSGFHVDPGYKGKLVYAVYNAGASDIIIRHGEPLFLIWFASLLDPSSQYAYKKQGLSQIDSKFMGQAAGDIRSLPELSRKVESLTALVTAFSWACGIVLAFLALIVAVFAFMNFESARERGKDAVEAVGKSSSSQQQTAPSSTAPSPVTKSTQPSPAK